MSERTQPISLDALDAVVKAYDIRGLCPEQLDADMCRGLGAAFARFVGTPSVVQPRSS